MGGLAFLCWYSFNEEDVDLWLQFRNLAITPIKFHVLLDGLDPDLGKVKAHTRVESDSFLWLSETCNKYFGPLGTTKDVQILYEDSSLTDENRGYQALGLTGIQQRVDDPDYATHKQFLTAKRPDPVDQELTVVGNPRWFPFDEYWLIATMQAGGYAVRKEKACKLTTGYDIDLRFPGYVAREIPGKELLAWNGNPAITSKLPAPKYEAKFWMEKGLAVSIQRPLFIKVLAVFCLLLALVSIPFVAFKSKPETYLVNCAAYFVGLWAVRGIIAVNAPKSPTIVDYVVLMLYCCQVLIVVGRVLWKTKAN
ncbi:MAG: hypothetical protein LAO09_22255 [Acidobacteriia bacterium]|nr:hypothetical protein [Terriglobia bacterium]